MMHRFVCKQNVNNIGIYEKLIQTLAILPGGMPEANFIYIIMFSQHFYLYLFPAKTVACWGIQVPGAHRQLCQVKLVKRDTWIKPEGSDSIQIIQKPNVKNRLCWCSLM